MGLRRGRSCKWSRSLNKIRELARGLADMFLDSLLLENLAYLLRSGLAVEPGLSHHSLLLDLIW